MNKTKRALLNDFDDNTENMIEHSVYFDYWDYFRNDSIINILEVVCNDFN